MCNNYTIFGGRTARFFWSSAPFSLRSSPPLFSLNNMSKQKPTSRGRKSPANPKTPNSKPKPKTKPKTTPGQPAHATGASEIRPDLEVSAFTVPLNAVHDNWSDNFKDEQEGYTKRLAISIATSGQLVPVLVDRDATRPEVYHVVDGFHRMAALRRISADSVRIVVRAIHQPGSDALASRILANVRGGVHPYDLAKGLVSLSDAGLTHANIAARLTMSRPAVSNHLRWYRKLCPQALAIWKSQDRSTLDHEDKETVTPVLLTTNHLSALAKLDHAAQLAFLSDSGIVTDDTEGAAADATATATATAPARRLGIRSFLPVDSDRLEDPALMVPAREVLRAIALVLAWSRRAAPDYAELVRSICVQRDLLTDLSPPEDIDTLSADDLSWYFSLLVSRAEPLPPFPVAKEVVGGRDN